MAKKLYVGNLPWSVTNADLLQLVEEEGLTCSSAEVVLDRDTDRSRGFAFIQFESDDDAVRAIAILDGYELGGRKLVVNEAQSRHRDRGGRPQRSGGDRRGFGGGGGGGGGRARKPRGYVDDDQGTW